MKRLFYATLAAIAVGATGCTEKISGDSLPTLDVEAAIDNPRAFDLHEIAENIEFIPLDDSSREGLLGEISKIEESKTGFYIQDPEWGATVRLFDKTGKFVATRGRIGRGPDEVSNISDIAVDYDRDNVYVNGSLAYDSAGAMFTRNDSIGGSLTVFHDGRLLSLETSPDAAGNEARFDFIKMYSGDLKPQGVIDAPYLGPTDYFFTDRRPGAYGQGSFTIVSDNGERLAVKQGRNDTIYHYSAGALRPAMVMNMGRYTFPDEGYGRDPLVAKSERTHVVTDLWESERWIVVTAGNFQRLPSGGGRLPAKRLIFDREDGLGGFSATGPEGLPGLYIDGIVFKPMYIRDNRLTGYIRALDIADNAGKITDPDLRTLAATLKEDSNPVMVVAELKK